MSSIDLFLSWLDEALIEAEHKLKLEQDGFRLLNAGLEDGRASASRPAVCSGRKV
jgi:hypothetical protein